MRSHDHESDEDLSPAALGADRRAPLGACAPGSRRRAQRRARQVCFSASSASVGNSGVGALLNDEERSPVHDVITSGGGSPLAPEVRDEMQGRLGHDFSDVRVHNDSRAHESAQSVNAHAYTVGSNVVFQRDKYDPSSAEGKTMLAHELTHVVQQRSGPVDGTAAQGGIKVSDPVRPVRAGSGRQRGAGHVRARPRRADHRRCHRCSALVQRDEVPEEEEEPSRAASSNVRPPRRGAGRDRGLTPACRS